eukprot:scaffold127215_cov58-Phaeocystis_antarctica.AAC.2
MAQMIDKLQEPDRKQLKTFEASDYYCDCTKTVSEVIIMSPDAVFSSGLLRGWPLHGRNPGL